VATRTLKFALADAQFPFLSTQQPRAVLSADLDAAGRVPRSFFGSEDSFDFNTVQVLYAENVIPVSEGWRSVRYEPAVPSPSAETPAGGFPSTGFQKFFELRASDPEGTASAVASPTTPLLNNSESASLIVQRSALTYKMYIKFPIVYESTFDVTWDQISVEWQATTLSEFPVVLRSPGLSYANVQGCQFLCIPGFGIVFAGASTAASVTKFRFLLQVCTADDTRVRLAGATNNQLITNVPFNYADISVIGQSNGYLLIAAKNEIAWAVFDGIAFNFSAYENNEITGSDVRIPEDLIGEITAIASLPGGYILFSEQNAVAAFYNSSNAVSPWIFRLIPNAGGVRSGEYVTDADESGGVFAYTSAGIQQITLQQAKDLEPTANDFLMGRRQETWSPASKLFTSFTLSESYFAKVRFLGKRYLVISYGASGANTFLYALVFDTSLKRWGKLQRPHVDVFDYFPAGGVQPATIGSLGAFRISDLAGLRINELTTDPEQQITRGRQMLVMMNNSGAFESVVLDNRDSSDNTTNGVLVLGKLQVSRSRLTVLHRVELEGTESDCIVTVQPSIDGRNPHRNVNYMRISNAGDYQEFAGFEVAVNHGIIIEGQFDLCTVLVEVDTEGQV
jgi:hypothetical protein